MAGIDSSKEDGWSQARRTSASLSCQPKETMFCLQERSDYNRVRGLSDEKYQQVNGSKRHHKSDISEESRRINAGPAVSPTLSSTGHPSNFEVRAMSSDLSLRMSYANTTRIHTTASESSAGAGTRLPPPELQRSPSPRSQIRMFQAENPRIVLPNQSGPMDRFLQQDDHLAGFADDTERMKEGIRLRSLRTNALRHRALLKIKRKELREKQAAKISSDEAFIRYVRENRSVHRGSNSKTLSDDIPEAYYTAMQIARDEYGPLEDEYTLIEDTLDKIEFEMAKIETRLYGPELPHQREESSTLAALPQLEDSRAPGPAENSFLGLSTGVSDRYEPLHAEYLSRLGDLDLARERYQNMIQEHESLLSEQESRFRVGLELNANLKVFLENLPAREAALQGEIMEIEVDVDRLRGQCLEAGIDLEEPSDGSESEIHMEIEVNKPEYGPEMASGLPEKGI